MIDPAYRFLAENVFAAAFFIGVAAVLFDIAMKRRRKLSILPGGSILFGAGAAIFYFIVMLGVGFAAGAELSAFLSRPDLTAVAMFAGAAAYAWQAIRARM